LWCAVSNPDDLANAIQVADFEVGCFRGPHATAIQRRQNRAMAKISRGFQDGFNLFLAQNDGELLLVPRQGDTFNFDLAVQGVAIKEAKPADGLNCRKRF
jgi:hypothetical protein